MKDEWALLGAAHLARSLPRLRGAGRVSNSIRKFFVKRWRGGLVRSRFRGVEMLLDPRELLDSWILFCPQWYDSNEFAHLQRTLRPGDVFVDVGANLGVYSIVAAEKVGSAGSVVAIEANPQLAQRLRSTVEGNALLTSVLVIEVGVSDCNETRILRIQTSGNVGGSTMLSEKDPDLHGSEVEVPCKALHELLDRPPTVLKLDIEGMEFRVLQRFLSESLERPKAILVERNNELYGEGDVLELLPTHGYVLTASWGANFWFELPKNP